MQKITIFIDIETSTLIFVNINFVKLHKILIVTLTKLVKLRLVDDKLVSNIIHMTQINLFLNEHKKNFWCIITFLRKFELILDMFWIKHYDVQIFNKSRFLIFNFDDCLRNCLHEHRSTTIFNKETHFKNRFFFKSLIQTTTSILSRSRRLRSRK